MPKLKNHLILFDADCPICTLYAKAMTDTGLADTAGRQSYQDFSQQSCPLLDRQRAADEMALVNLETGEVIYGINSLFKIFATTLPVLKPLFLLRPFIWFMSKLYAFIAFNRRVIAPPPSKKNDLGVQPTFRPGYRLAYLIFAWAVAAWLLTEYTEGIGGAFDGKWTCLWAIILGGQILFQWLIIVIVRKSRTWDYLGNMMTVLLEGGLLLLPIIFLSGFWRLPIALQACYGLSVAAIVIADHIRRCRRLQLGWLPTVTWIVYTAISMALCVF